MQTIVEFIEAQVLFLSREIRLKKISLFLLIIILVLPLTASAAEAQQCYSGFHGISKTLMAIPYALANVFATLGAIIYMAITMVLAILCIAVGASIGFFELLVNSDHSLSKSLFSQVGYFFSISLNWYNAVLHLSDWYNGTCVI